MLRFIITVLFIGLFLILSIPFILVESIIGIFNKEKKSRHYLKLVSWAFNTALFFCGTKTTVLGAENIPSEPVLYVGNHRSIFDILVVYPLVHDLTGFVAKKNLKNIPLLATWMRNLHCLFLDRKDTREGLKVILAAIEKVKSGI